MNARVRPHSGLPPAGRKRASTVTPQNSSGDEPGMERLQKVMAAAGSSIASTVTYLTPVVAVIAGVILLHEPLTWFEPLGGVIVLVGAAIGQGRLRRRSQTLRS